MSRTTCQGTNGPFTWIRQEPRSDMSLLGVHAAVSDMRGWEMCRGDAFVSGHSELLPHVLVTRHVNLALMGCWAEDRSSVGKGVV